jgi:hypothetical protein
MFFEQVTRIRRADFLEAIERIEQVVLGLGEAERDAFCRLINAPPGPAKSAALHAYRRAATVHKKAVDRRLRFLEKHRP